MDAKTDAQRIRAARNNADFLEKIEGALTVQRDQLIAKAADAAHSSQHTAVALLRKTADALERAPIRDGALDAGELLQEVIPELLNVLGRRVAVGGAQSRVSKLNQSVALVRSLQISGILDVLEPAELADYRNELLNRLEARRGAVRRYGHRQTLTAALDKLRAAAASEFSEEPAASHSGSGRASS
jgi:hypothetical protein